MCFGSSSSFLWLNTKLQKSIYPSQTIWNLEEESGKGGGKPSHETVKWWKRALAHLRLKSFNFKEDFQHNTEIACPVQSNGLSHRFSFPREF